MWFYYCYYKCVVITTQVQRFNSHTTACDAIDVQVEHTIIVLSVMRLHYCNIHIKRKQKYYFYYYCYFSLLCLSGIRR